MTSPVFSSRAELEAWATNYIADAATARVTITSPDGRKWEGNSNYDPLEGSGVHLCGQTDDGQQPTTVANYPMRNEAEARELWQIAKDVADCVFRDQEDFLVDLVTPDGIADDFSSNRQLWPRAIAAWNARRVTLAHVHLED